MEKNKHILIKLSAHLLIAASVLCVLFGNGTHIHSVFDHVSDHGDIHAVVHAHPFESNHNHSPEFGDKDAHQHPTATVDLTGTLTQKTVRQVSTNTDVFSAPAVLSSLKTLQSLNPLYLDLPPPDHLFQSNNFSSLSLRGPPLG